MNIKEILLKYREKVLFSFGVGFLKDTMHTITTTVDKNVSLDPISYGLTSNYKVKSIQFVNAELSNTARIYVKSNSITLVDSGGVEYVVTADIKGYVTPNEFFNAWNTAFLAYPDPFVKDMVLSISKYSTTFNRTSAKQIEGYENIDNESTTNDYRGPSPYFYIYKYRSTSHAWIKNDTTTIDSAFPFISNTLRTTYLNSTAVQGGVGVVWTSSIKSTKRYFIIEGSKWLNSSISLSYGGDSKLVAYSTPVEYNAEVDEYSTVRRDDGIKFDLSLFHKDDTIEVKWMPAGYDRLEYDLMDYSSPKHSVSVELTFA